MIVRLSSHAQFTPLFWEWIDDNMTTTSWQHSSKIASTDTQIWCESPQVTVWKFAEPGSEIGIPMWLFVYLWFCSSDTCKDLLQYSHLRVEFIGFALWQLLSPRLTCQKKIKKPGDLAMLNLPAGLVIRHQGEAMLIMKRLNRFCVKDFAFRS